MTICMLNLGCFVKIDENYNRKLKIPAALTTAKSLKRPYSEVMNQNKSDRKRSKNGVSS